MANLPKNLVCFIIMYDELDPNMDYDITLWHNLIHVAYPTLWDKASLLLYMKVVGCWSTTYVPDSSSPTHTSSKPKILINLLLKVCTRARNLVQYLQF